MKVTYHLQHVNVDDARIGVADLAVPDLAVGASETVDANYTITAQDLVDGNITNQAAATGTSPKGTDVNDTSDESSPTEDDPTVTPLDENPAISIVKTAVVAPGATIGDVITYSFLVSNEGNVPLTAVNVDDARIGVADLAVPDLAVGASETVDANYTITAQDLVDGNITNQATATGTSPKGTDVNDTSDESSPTEDDPTVTPLDENPAISIVKTAVVAPGATIGDIITYSFLVSNEGNVPLTGVNVDDARIGVADLAVPDLAVGASETVDANYTITAQDLVDGNITNQATATGTSPKGTDVNDTSDESSPTEDDPTVTPLDENPAISIVKTAVVAPGATIGDVITYSFLVSNEGNVPLTACECR